MTITLNFVTAATFLIFNNCPKLVFFKLMNLASLFIGMSFRLQKSIEGIIQSHPDVDFVADVLLRISLLVNSPISVVLECESQCFLYENNFEAKVSVFS